MNIRKLTSRLVAGVMMALSIQSLAAGDHINADANDVAVKGYDVVSYFQTSGPVQGRPKYSASYQDAVYYFSTASNRDTFRASPASYAPQFGGYCAMGVALNKKLDVDPMAWRIVDGKLYLNLNKQVQKKWLTDTEGYIATAERNWYGINSLAAAELNAE
ncbi:MAG: YHS domain-containing (seleno)protein [Halieaceae bacterium]|nr:YHS domain-containing (seleno)protein [Halieaceae bacterium]